MSRKWSPVLFGAGTVLAIGVGVSIWSAMQEREVTAWPPLAERIPAAIDGWQGEDLPLGPTESAEEAVGKLNYNDYIYRVYRKNGREVFVYAMFWRQGRISVREMAGHTPDGCWVSNGARLLSNKDTRHFSGEDGATYRCEVRRFDMGESSEVSVAWWHLWGGVPVERSFAEKSVRAVIREILQWLNENRGRARDQLMVRVHGTEDIESVLKTLPAQKFLKAIPEVWERAPEGAGSG